MCGQCRRYSQVGRYVRTLKCELVVFPMFICHNQGPRQFRFVCRFSLVFNIHVGIVCAFIDPSACCVLPHGSSAEQILSSYRHHIHYGGCSLEFFMVCYDFSKQWLEFDLVDSHSTVVIYIVQCGTNTDCPCVHLIYCLFVISCPIYIYLL